MNPVELLGTLIALVGIYLLLSLIGTAFSELLVNKLGLRGETLDKVVEGILGPNGRDALFTHPKILSLTEDAEFGRPSRWVAHVFFGMDSVPDKDRPKDAETVSEIAQREFHQLPAFFRFDKVADRLGLVVQAQTSTPAANDPKAKPRRRPSAIPADTFAQITLELVFGINWKNTALDAVALRGALQPLRERAKLLGDPQGTAFLDQLDNWIGSSSDPATDLPAKLVAWFGEVNVRAQGWFKRRITRSLLILGVMIAAATNGDTLQLFQRLSEDPVARKQALDLSERLIEGSTKDCSTIDPKVDPSSAASCLRQMTAVPIADAGAEPATGADACSSLVAHSSIADAAVAKSCLLKAPKGLIVTVSPRLSSCDDGTALPKDSLRCYAGELSPLLGWSADPLLELKAPAVWRLNPDGESWLKWLQLLGAKLLGVLLTAGAISLGAPFWFDLLQKLIAARKALSGGGAATSDGASTTSTSAPIAPAGSPAAGVTTAGIAAVSAGSVKALVSPAEDSRYAAGLTRFAPDATRFDLANAYWLAWMSKLAYENDATVIASCGAIGLAAQPFSGTTDIPNLNLPLGLAKVDTQGFAAWDDRNCFIVFRGTEQNPQDWLTDLSAKSVAFDKTTSDGLVHQGFLTALKAVWTVSDDNIAGGSLGRILDERSPNASGISGGGRRLWFAGHSLGGALAVLAAREIGDWAIQRNLKLREEAAKGASGDDADRLTRRLYGERAGLYTFGQPRVGNAGWAARAEADFGSRWHRFVNASDIVPRVPLRAMGYVDVGRVQYFDEQGRLHERPDAWFRWLDTVILNEGSLKERGKAAAANHSMALYLARVNQYAGIAKAAAAA